VKQGSNHYHLRPLRAEALGRINATFITNHEPGQGQRHVERMLHVVVGRVAAKVAGILAGEEPFEVVEGKPQLVERGAGVGVGEQFLDSVAYRGRFAHLHGIGHIKVITPILGHYSFLFLARGQASHVAKAGFLVCIHAMTRRAKLNGKLPLIRPISGSMARNDTPCTANVETSVLAYVKSMNATGKIRQSPAYGQTGAPRFGVRGRYNWPDRRRSWRRWSGSGRYAGLQEFAERFALERATQNVIAPLLCVVHVAILGRDIEIAEHDELVVGFQFVCKEALQGSQPAELVLIFFRTDATTLLPLGTYRLMTRTPSIVDASMRRCGSSNPGKSVT